MILNTSIKAALLGLLTASTACAALPLNDQQTLTVQVSKNSLTRVSVQDDVIQDIFVYPQLIQGQMVQDSLQLHKSGHVFIAPEGLNQSFYLTLMTGRGRGRV